jgi:hypothetical protein
MPLNTEAFAKCVNLSAQAYYVLDNGLASYADLDSRLTLEDAITMIEFHQVSGHNKALMEELRNELSNRR